MSEWAAQVEQLRGSAAALAGALSRTARPRTTLGQERAILRLFGVDGLDAAGRPLAASVIEHSCSSGKALGGGIALPFGVAMREYDLPPHELALEVASGAIDLQLEADLLDDPDVARSAREVVQDLAAAALARIDANRVAERELRMVLGEPAAPQLGFEVDADEMHVAAEQVRCAAADGATLMRVRVPTIWELRRETEPADRSDARGGRHNRGEPPRSGRRPGGPGRTRGGGQAAGEERTRVGGPADAWGQVPAGSQRGLSLLRESADRAAAERGAYVSLMTVASPLAAPEQAVVAAFERVDFVEADAVREIVEGNADPDRVLADHAFARRLDVRAGRQLFVGPGPLTIARDIESGLPASLATRAGRALALQALEVELALGDGVPASSLVVGGVPSWAGDGGATALVAQAWLRSVVFADHRVGLEMPEDDEFPLVATFCGIRVAERRPLPLFVLAATPAAGLASAAPAVARAAASALAIGASLGDGRLHGDAENLARETLITANELLERFAAEGWSSVLGSGEALVRLGAGGVAGRTYDLGVLGVLGAR